MAESHDKFYAVQKREQRTCKEAKQNNEKKKIVMK